MRFRKQQELHQGIESLTGKQHVDNNEVTMLTSCPACQQGLSRYQLNTGLKSKYIVVELAEQLLGESWQSKFISETKKGGIERVLL